MSEKAYECNSCGYQIFAEPDKTVSDNWCPACRATMYEADIPVPDKLVDYKCEECGAEFKVPAALLLNSVGNSSALNVLVMGSIAKMKNMLTTTEGSIMEPVELKAQTREADPATKNNTPVSFLPILSIITPLTM
jgi:DNA-directed RNA polymerase subunit RPC12/RpoP